MNPNVLANSSTWVERVSKAIGGDDDQKTFTLQIFEMQADSKIYLFSDGYQDQFGGEKNKKFNSSTVCTHWQNEFLF